MIDISTTRSRHRGLSLIELMIALTVAAIIAAAAVPNFSAMLARQQLRSAVEQLRADLTLARSEALRRNATVYVRFTRNADGSWCYGLSLDDSCLCSATSGAQQCFLDRDAADRPLRRVVSSQGYRGVTMAAPAAFGGSLAFSPVRPGLRNDSAVFIGGGREARVLAALRGRIRSCSPSGAAYLYLFDPC